jgi:hypothetical protein
MKKYSWPVTALAALCLLAQVATAQNFEQFALTEAGNPNALTRTGGLHKTTDGGYVFCGTRSDQDYARAFVVKTDANLQPQWYYHLNLTFNAGASWQASYGVEVAEIAPNRYALLAGVNMFFLNNAAAQNLDYALVVFDKNNAGTSIVSAMRYGGEFADVPNAMVRTQDGGFLLSGYSNNEQALNVPTQTSTFLVKIAADYTLQWQKRYVNTATNCFTTAFTLLPDLMRRPAIQTADGGFVFNLACDAYNYFAKVSADGTLLWTKRFDSAAGIGDGIDDNGGNFLAGGAGTGGATVSLHELPNGDLAFLGNQFTFLVAFLGLPVQAGGVTLPMGYLFTTDASGNFKSGMAFFHERYNDTNLPIEMNAYDFAQLPNGNFQVFCGLDTYVNGGTFYRPGVVEIDLSKPALDEGDVQGVVFDYDYFYTGESYPFGINKLVFSADASAIAFQGGKLIRYEGGFSNDIVCTKKSGTLHTFGITMVLSASDLKEMAGNLNSGILDPKLTSQVAAVNTVCTGTVAQKEPLPQRTGSVSNIRLAPSPASERLQILFGEATAESGRYEVFDLSGRLVLSGDVTTETLEVTLDVSALQNGIYVLRVVTGRESVTKQFRKER